MNNALLVSKAIEKLLVRRNLRGMQPLSKQLPAGYILRAAQQLQSCTGTLFIGTGFPVINTFETDGPLGAIALYNAMQTLNAKPALVCGRPLFEKLPPSFQCVEIQVNALENATDEASKLLLTHQPELIISIERPGLAANGRYHNMRGEDISERCASFDHVLNQAQCPTIAIGDGGNEIGMGNVLDYLSPLDIVPSVTCCDELIVADVSNWGAYGLIAMLEYLTSTPLLSAVKPRELVQFLSDLGSVDGVTRLNTLTEDGLCIGESERLINELSLLIIK